MCVCSGDFVSFLCLYMRVCASAIRKEREREMIPGIYFFMSICFFLVIFYFSGWIMVSMCFIFFFLTYEA